MRRIQALPERTLARICVTRTARLPGVCPILLTLVTILFALALTAFPLVIRLFTLVQKGALWKTTRM